MKKKASEAACRYVRTTITVPADLKARMDGVRDPVNWSRLASEAFARRLEELDAPPVAACLGGMARRLREARQPALDAPYRCGWELGRQWAVGQADLAHLVRIERLYRTMPDEDWALAGDHAGDLFLARLCPALYRDPDRRECFWRSAAVGDRRLLRETAFVRGFFESVLDAWLRVKDEVGVPGWWCPSDGEADRQDPAQEEKPWQPRPRQKAAHEA